MKVENVVMKEVWRVEKVLINSIDEFNEFKEFFECLCIIIECFYSCVNGIVCSICYEDFISRE